MKQLVLATHNRHKAEELQAMLAGMGIEVLTLDSFPHVGEIPEDELTLEGNALFKAREVFRMTSLPSLADDTGLEVHALNNAPGVFSARYAGIHATFEDNVRKLLGAMKDVAPQNRAARFRAALAFVAPGMEKVVEGVCPGSIIEHPRGNDGFGYDPVFIPDGCTETFAEMSTEQKNTLSHRAKAFMLVKDILQEYYR